MAGAGAAQHVWDEEKAELSGCSSRTQQAALPELSMEGENSRGTTHKCLVHAPVLLLLLKVQLQHTWERARSETQPFPLEAGAVSPGSLMAVSCWGDDKSSCRLLGSSQDGQTAAQSRGPAPWQESHSLTPGKALPGRSCHHQHAGACCSCSASLGGDVRFGLSASAGGIPRAEHGESGSVPLGAWGRRVPLSPVLSGRVSAGDCS